MNADTPVRRFARALIALLGAMVRALALRPARYTTYSMEWWFAKTGTLIALVLITSWIGAIPAVEQASDLLSDGLEVLASPAADDRMVQKVALVEISDADYLHVFDQRSPLNSARLSDVVAMILNADPALVVIDILTDHREFQDLWKQIGEKTAQDPLSKTLWIRGVTLNNAGDAIEDLQPVLAGLTEPQPRSAVALFQPDRDGRLREVRTCIAFGQNPPQVSAVQVVGFRLRDGAPGNQGTGNRWCEAEEQAAHGEHAGLVRPAFLRYLNQSERFTVSQVLAGQAKELQGRVVFLGGDYSLDRYYMADGFEYPGVEALAAASMAIAAGHQYQDWHDWRKWVLKFLLGALLTVILARFGPRIGFWAMLLLAVPGVLLLSWLVLVHLGGVLDIAGLVAAIFVEHGIETAAEAGELKSLEHKLEAENQALQAENIRLKQQVNHFPPAEPQPSTHSH